MKHQGPTRFLPQLNSISPATPADARKGRVSAYPHTAQIFNDTAAAEDEDGDEDEHEAVTEVPPPHVRTAAVRHSDADGYGIDTGGSSGGSSSGINTGGGSGGGASEDPNGGSSGVGTTGDAQWGRARRTSARLQNRQAAIAAAATPLDPQLEASKPPLPLSSPKLHRGSKRSSQNRRTARSSSGEMAAPPLKRRQRRDAAAAATGAATVKDDQAAMIANPDGAVLFSAGPKWRGVLLPIANTAVEREMVQGEKEAATAAAAAAAEEEEEEEEEVGKARGKKDLKEKKPPRRTKAVLRNEEIRSAASQGVFAQHLTLHELYPHSRSYGPGPVPLSSASLAAAADGNARLAAAATAAAAATIQVADGGDSASNGGTGDDSSGSFRSDEPRLSAGRGRGRGRSQLKVTAGPAAGISGEGATATAAAAAISAAPSQPPLIKGRPMPKILPNLGYACLCMTLRKNDIFASRDTSKAGFQTRGLEHVSKLALANSKDLRPLIEWNEAHGIRVFRLSSGIFPWMSYYQLEELQDAHAIKQALADAGAAAQRYGHRITFHPSEFTKIASDKSEVVETSIKELEVHSRIFDLMGFLPATTFNKINIHVGGVYGDKTASLDRFTKVVLERLSSNCRARLTVENDDKPSLYSVRDLMYLANKAHIPIVFDFHHHRFCTGGLSEEEALHQALSTWPPGVRPIVHWSESQEGRRANAHSDYVSGPIYLYGMKQEVDVMIESKAKELALLHYREAALAGKRAERPPLKA